MIISTRLLADVTLKGTFCWPILPPFLAITSFFKLMPKFLTTVFLPTMWRKRAPLRARAWAVFSSRTRAAVNSSSSLMLELEANNIRVV